MSQLLLQLRVLWRGGLLVAANIGKRELEIFGGGILYDIIPKAYHEQIIYDDGTNSCFGNDGMIYNKNVGKYDIDKTVHCDDIMMRKAEQNVQPSQYNFCTNNCQDYQDKLKIEYQRIYKQNGSIQTSVSLSK